MKAVVVYFRVPFCHLHGVTEENYENRQSRYPVSGPRFEPVTSKVRSSRPNHSTETRVVSDYCIWVSFKLDARQRRVNLTM
jgi:hypothetical protein